MATFRNKGSDTLRPDGRTIKAGETFETTEREDTVNHWPKKHTIGIRFERVDQLMAVTTPAVKHVMKISVDTVDADKAAKALTAAAPKIAEKVAEATEWTAKISPELYLARFGDDAPRSALAKTIIAAQK